MWRHTHGQMQRLRGLTGCCNRNYSLNSGKGNWARFAETLKALEKYPPSLPELAYSTFTFPNFSYGRIIATTSTDNSPQLSQETIQNNAPSYDTNKIFRLQTKLSTLIERIGTVLMTECYQKQNNEHRTSNSEWKLNPATQIRNKTLLKITIFGYRFLKIIWQRRYA